jgi:hypothetical protein
MRMEGMGESRKGLTRWAQHVGRRVDWSSRREVLGKFMVR